MAHVLITRPFPLAQETAAHVAKAGHTPLICPLMHIKPVTWRVPKGHFDALLMTSVHAALSVPAHQLGVLAELPLYAIGQRTATEARKAGYTHIACIGTQDVEHITARAKAEGHQHILHLCTKDVTLPRQPEKIETCIVYQSDPVSHFTPQAHALLQEGKMDWVLLFSSKSARIFRSLHDRTGFARDTLSVGAISPKVLRETGQGWRQLKAACTPSTQEILHVTGLS